MPTIRFYGHCIDQYGNHVGGANVVMEVVRPVTERESRSGEDWKVDRIQRTSDAHGMFSVVGPSGLHLRILIVEKPGFEAEAIFPAIYSFEPSVATPYLSDAFHPITFRMWKNGAFEPIVKVDHNTMGPNGMGGTYLIPYNTRYVVDLVAEKGGADRSEGDFAVEVRRPKDASLAMNYTWSVIMQPIQGGIQETEDAFLYEAPEDGYAPLLETGMQGDDPSWTNVLKRKLYLRSRDGHVYSGIDFQLTLNDDGAFVEMSYRSNPASSRNLQFDPAKQLNRR